MTLNHRNRITIPFGMSLALHALLLGALVWWGLTTFEGPAGDDDGSSGASSKETTVEEDIESAVEDVAKRIDQGLAQAGEASAAENLQKTDAGAAWIETHSSDKSVEAVGAAVREAYDVPKRAYKPVNPPPAGPFHTKSMLPYSSERKVDEDGIERTYQTWVDKDGRTMVQTRRKMIDDKGKHWIMQGVFQPDGSLFEMKMADETGDDTFSQALEKATQSPLMQKLFSEAVLPVLEAKRREQEGNATPLPKKSPGK